MTFTLRVTDFSRITPLVLRVTACIHEVPACTERSRSIGISRRASEAQRENFVRRNGEPSWIQHFKV